MELIGDVFLIRRKNPLTEYWEYWHEETIPCEFVEKIRLATRYDTRDEAEESARIIRNNHFGEIEVDPTRILRRKGELIFCDPID